MSVLGLCSIFIDMGVTLDLWHWG